MNPASQITLKSTDFSQFVHISPLLIPSGHTSSSSCSQYTLNSILLVQLQSPATETAGIQSHALSPRTQVLSSTCASRKAPSPQTSSTVSSYPVPFIKLGSSEKKLNRVKLNSGRKTRALSCPFSVGIYTSRRFLTSTD